MAVHPSGDRAARRTRTETSAIAERANGSIAVLVSTSEKNQLDTRLERLQDCCMALIISKKHTTRKKPRQI